MFATVVFAWDSRAGILVDVFICRLYLSFTKVLIQIKEMSSNFIFKVHLVEFKKMF